MVKRLLISAALLLLLCAGCGERLAVTLLGSTDATDPDVGGQTNQYTVRVGAMLGEDQATEIGLSTTGWTRDAANQFFGVYVLRYLPEDPNGLLGQVFIGGRASLDLDEDGGAFGPLIGTVMDVGGIDFVTQYGYVRYDQALKTALGGTDGEHVVSVGPLLRF